MASTTPNRRLNAPGAASRRQLPAGRHILWDLLPGSGNPAPFAAMVAPLMAGFLAGYLAYDLTITPSIIFRCVQATPNTSNATICSTITKTRHALRSARPSGIGFFELKEGVVMKHWKHLDRYSIARGQPDPLPRKIIEKLLQVAVQAPNHYRVRPGARSADWHEPRRTWGCDGAIAQAAAPGLAGSGHGKGTHQALRAPFSSPWASISPKIPESWRSKTFVPWQRRWRIS